MSSVGRLTFSQRVPFVWGSTVYSTICLLVLLSRWCVTWHQRSAVSWRHCWQRKAQPLGMEGHLPWHVAPPRYTHTHSGRGGSDCYSTVCLQAKIDSIVGSQCLYCGDVMIMSVSQPLIPPERLDSALLAWKWSYLDRSHGTKHACRIARFICTTLSCKTLNVCTVVVWTYRLCVYVCIHFCIRSLWRNGAVIIRKMHVSPEVY